MQTFLDLLQTTLQFFASPPGTTLIAIISLLIAVGALYSNREQTSTSTS